MALAPVLTSTVTLSTGVAGALTLLFESINLIPDAAARSAEELAKLNEDFERFVNAEHG